MKQTEAADQVQRKGGSDNGNESEAVGKFASINHQGIDHQYNPQGWREAWLILTTNSNETWKQHRQEVERKHLAVFLPSK